jgi:hypothetical protein
VDGSLGRGSEAPALAAEGADSVERKLTIPESERRSALAALGIDRLQALMRQVYFFDTPELTLTGAGMVVRAPDLG